MATHAATQKAEDSRPSEEAIRLGNRLLVSIREDVAAQERVLKCLVQQEVGVSRPTEPAFVNATAALEKELERQPFRKIQRDGLLRELSAAFGAETSALTLGSVAERLGDAGRPLLLERGKLRLVTLEVQRQNRRLAALIRTHRDVTREILYAVLGDGSDGDLLGGGTLIDAEV